MMRERVVFTICKEIKCMENKENNNITKALINIENQIGEFQIIWGDRYLMIKGKNYDTDFHSHHGIQICLSLEQPLRIIQGQKQYSGEVILVGHQVPHALDKNEYSLVILVEPNSVEGQALRRRLGDNEIAIASLPIELKRMLFSHELYQEGKSNESNILFKELVILLTGEQIKQNHIDERITACLEHIKAGKHENDYSIRHLADTVYLSESRLQHLFKERVGVSISSYIQWVMVLKVAKYVLEGKSLTNAAYAVGFADLSHFSRAFRGMFGKPLTHYLKESSSVQVFFV